MRGDSISTLLMYSIVPIALFGFAVQFITLRIRDSRATPQDPHLGRKSMLYFFFNGSIFLVLIGLTISSLNVYELLFESAVNAQERRKHGLPEPPMVDPQTGQPIPPVPVEWFNDQQRLGAGLITSGLVYGILFFTLIHYFTNDRDFPAVRRAFASIRFTVAGLIVFTAATVGIVSTFQKGEYEYKTLQTIFAVSLIWWPVALLHLVLVLKSVGWQRVPKS